MNSETIVMCVVALLLGMLLANMIKSVCGCKTITEGFSAEDAYINIQGLFEKNSLIKTL